MTRRRLRLFFARPCNVHVRAWNGCFRRAASRSSAAARSRSSLGRGGAAERSGRAASPASIAIVNQHYPEVDGEPTVPDLKSLPFVPDPDRHQRAGGCGSGDRGGGGRRPALPGAVILSAGLGYGADSLAEIARADGAAARHAPDRAELPRRHGAACQAQCEFRARITRPTDMSP